MNSDNVSDSETLQCENKLKCLARSGVGKFVCKLAHFGRLFSPCEQSYGIKRFLIGVTGMMRLVMLACLGVMAIVVSGCAVMSKTDCLEGNWRAAGQNDAVRGHTSSTRLASRIRVCNKHGATANKVDYLLGYKHGLEQYCHPDNAIRLGLNNSPYRDICPDELQQAFLQQYISGLQTARREVWREYHWLEGKLFDTRVSRAYASEDKHLRQRAQQRIDRILNRLDELRTARFQINRRIAVWSTQLQSI